MVELFRKSLFALLASSMCTASNAERSREPLESFQLAELCLVSSETAVSGQRGSLRDGAGKLHAISIGSYVGPNSGRVESISTAGVELIEVVEAGGGDWREREARIEPCQEERAPRSMGSNYAFKPTAEEVARIIHTPSRSGGLTPR